MFTAFGELVDDASRTVNRYGFAGAYGYQEPSPETAGSGASLHHVDPLGDLGWLHVGARYYDPASGRFMQRDPLGVRGSLNGFSYMDIDPNSYVDPLGFQAEPVETPLVPWDSGPRYQISPGDRRPVNIEGPVRWYDAIFAPICYFLGCPYNAYRWKEPPPKPASACWYCSDCKAWQKDPTPHLHSR